MVIALGPVRAALSPCRMKRTAGLAPQRLRSSLACRIRGLDWSGLQKYVRRECDARPFHDAMPRHRTTGPRLGAVVSAPHWSTGPPWAADSNSNRRPCLNLGRLGYL